MTVNGALISNVDQKASNGVIHVVDHVLFPVSAYTVAGAIAVDPDYTLLSTFLALTGLDEVLDGGCSS